MKLLTYLLKILKLCIYTFYVVVFIGCSSPAQSDLEDDIPADDTEMVDNTDEDEEEPVDTNYDITSILSVFDNLETVSYSVSNGMVTISTTNLPDHKTPYYLDTEWHEEKYAGYSGNNSSFHLNQNRISEQSITFSITLNPEEANNKEATPMGPIGISRNGVVFFNQYAAGGSGLDNEKNSFDQYFGHPAGTGMYHYHIEPLYLTEVYGDDAFLGLLADGFPVYGPLEDGVILSSTDLDDYHGHFSVTKEFPNGIYHYHISADAPYLNGDGFYGAAGTISR